VHKPKALSGTQESWSSFVVKWTSTQDSDFSEDWCKTKEEQDRAFIDDMKKKFKEFDSYLKSGTKGPLPWEKITSTLSLSRRTRLFNANESQLKEIVNGFMDLYQHNSRKAPQLNLLVSVSTILERLKVELSDQEPIDKPFSKALDKNGFSQKHIIGMLGHNKTGEQVSALSELFRRIYTLGGADLFFHNVCKLVLFQKTDAVNSWKDLRPIAILPAWLISVEKLELYP
jgi:hypothetical protein